MTDLKAWDLKQSSINILSLLGQGEGKEKENMDRNEAKKAAEVMLAYADGKEIECGFKNGAIWESAMSPSFNWNEYDYRIKPQPKYRPFKDAEECWQEMQKHQPFGWVKNKSGEERYNIVSIDTKYIYFSPTMSSTNYNIVFDEYTFADGEPFGVKEEDK